MTDILIRCCPFCGSHEVEIARTNKHACWIECAECGAQTACHRTRKGAIERWNRRHFDEIPATIVHDMDKERRLK